MKTTDFIKENFVAAAEEAHQDHEVQMARGQCYNAAKYAMEIHKMLKDVSEMEGIEGWVAAKITMAEDYLNTVRDYLNYQEQSQSSEMPEFDIGSATQTLDAVLGEGLLDIFKDKEVKKPARVADEPGKVSFSDLGKNSIFDPNDKRNTDDQRVFYEFMLSQKNKSNPDDFINTLQHYIRKYKEAARKEGGNNPHNSGRLKVLSYLDSQMAATQNYRDTWQTLTAPNSNAPATAKQPVAEDDYDDAVAAFLAKNKPTQGKAHPPRSAERLGGSKHIGTLGGSGASKGRVSGLSANTGAKTKPVVTAEDEEEPEPKRKPAVVKTNKPIGTRVADIGPGGKEYNVKTDKAWDDQHKEKHGVAEVKADPTGSWVVYNGGKVKRFKTREGAKAYAEKNGGKVASSEHYADKIQKQGVAEGLNEFAPDGFNGSDDGEEFNPRMAKMAYDEGVVKGASLADGATLQRAMAINDWDKHDGGIYKQHFAKGFKAGRLDKIRHNNKQYNLNLKLMKDGSIRHGEQGVAEGSTWYAGNGAIKEKISKYEELALKANREGDDAKTKMYQQKIQTLKQKMSHMEESAGGMGAASVATSMGGGNGFANGGPGTIARPRMKKKK